MAWHTLGTVSVTKNSSTVTGSGTNWVENIRVGDGFNGPDGRMYQITNVASNTSIAIAPAYAGSSASGQTYAVVPVQGYVKRSADRLASVVNSIEDGAVEAIDAADNAKQSAAEAKASETSALAAKEASEAAEDRAQQAADDAVAVVSGGEASIEPVAGKIPLAGASGKIVGEWVDGSGVSGVPISGVTDLAYALDALNTATKQVRYGDGPYPSLDQQFVGATILDPRVNFTRGSEATGWVNGQLKTFGINEPRFVTDPLTGEALGLLLEPFTSTNLFRHSRGNGSFGYSTPEFQSNAMDSPVGPQNATLIKRCKSLQDRYEVNIPENSYPSGTRLTFRWMQKKINTTRLGTRGAFFHFSGSENLTFGDISKIADLKDGWELFEVHPEIVDGASGTAFRVYFGQYGRNSDGNYIEDPFAFDGLQLEVGDYATSHIPTNGSQVTRAGDFFSLPIGDWYRSVQGTLLVDAVVLKGSQAGGSVVNINENNVSYISTPDIHPNNVIRRTTVRANIQSYSSVLTTELLPRFKLGERFVSAVSWYGSSFVYADSGIVSDVAVNLEGFPNPIELRLFTIYNGGWSGGASTPSGIIRRITYYPRRLTDSQLIALTSLTEVTE